MIVLIDNFYPYRGGEPFLAKELEEASRIGEKIIVYPLNADKNERNNKLPDGIDVRLINTRSIISKIVSIISTPFDPMLWSDLKTIKKSGISIKKFSAAVFYAYQSNYYSSIIAKDIDSHLIKEENICIYSYWMHIQACVGYKLKRRYPTARFVSRAHGYDLYEFRASSGFLPGRTMIFKYVDHIFPVSHAGMKYLLEKYENIDNRKVSVSYLGTSDNGLNPENQDEIRIVSCSNAVSVKRIDWIIKALEKIKDISITWIHYGSGELLDSLKKEAQERLRGNISYLFAGCITNEELMKKYAQKHISFFINVSESEGLPVSIMEAMSFGIPVIATDVGGTREIVEDSRNGFLLDKNITPEMLSEIIVDAIKMNSAEYKKMRKEARKTWATKFDASVNYMEFYRLIK